jgi:hypothetical protein
MAFESLRFAPGNGDALSAYFKGTHVSIRPLLRGKDMIFWTACCGGVEATAESPIKAIEAVEEQLLARALAPKPAEPAPPKPAEPAPPKPQGPPDEVLREGQQPPSLDAEART